MNSDSPNSEPNRRKHLRIPTSAVCPLRELGPDDHNRNSPALLVRCCNLSQGGTLIVSSKELSPRVSLQLKRPDGSSEWFHATVIRGQVDTNAEWKYGLQFDQPLPLEIITHLIETQTQPHADRVVSETRYHHVAE